MIIIIWHYYNIIDYICYYFTHKLLQNNLAYISYDFLKSHLSFRPDSSKFKPDADSVYKWCTHMKLRNVLNMYCLFIIINLLRKLWLHWIRFWFSLTKCNSWIRWNCRNGRIRMTSNICYITTTIIHWVTLLITIAINIETRWHNKKVTTSIAMIKCHTRS